MAIAVALIVAAVLVLSTAWQLLRPYVKETNAMRTGIIAAIVVGLVLARVTPIRVLFVAAILGVVMGPPDPPLVTPEDR
jgi:chromate transport protein ChrA